MGKSYGRDVPYVQPIRVEDVTAYDTEAERTDDFINLKCPLKNKS